MKAKARVAAVVTLIAGALVLSAPASADYDPIGSGRTAIALDKRFLSFAKRHGVKVRVQETGARRRGKRLVLPVSGGRMDPTTGKGTVEHSGTVVFQRGKRRLPWRRLEVKMKRVPLQAKVGGSQLKVARAKRADARRAGFGVRFAAKGLTLTGKVATRLNKKLGLRSRPFHAGQPFASLRSGPQPLSVTVLPRGRATIALDPGFAAKMNSLFVSINPIFPAELAPGSTLLSVPIVRKGALAPDASLGTLRTAGAIEFLQQKGGQAFVREFWFEMGSRIALAELEIQPTPTFRGKLGQLGVLAIGPGALTSDPRARTIGVSGAPLALSPETAAAFDEGFAEGKPTFGAGEPFGVLSFNAQTQ
jgi:hypothetical protein